MDGHESSRGCGSSVREHDEIPAPQDHERRKRINQYQDPTGEVRGTRLPTATSTPVASTWPHKPLSRNGSVHWCPAKSRMESTGCRNRVSRSRIPALEVPVKRAFSRKASRSKSVGLGKDSPPAPGHLRT